MTKPQIILIGAGGHAVACIDVVEQHGRFEIAGLVDAAAETGSGQLGYSVIGSDADLPQFAKTIRHALLAVGQIGSPETRIHLFRRLVELEFELPSIVSPQAYLSEHADIGPGTILLHGAIVNAGASIGANCILNSKSLVDHDTVVADHCHLSTGSILNGAVQVGSGSFIGSGSIIREGVSIGKNCVVGMGLSVRHDLQDNTIFMGQKC